MAPCYEMGAPRGSTVYEAALACFELNCTLDGAFGGLDADFVCKDQIDASTPMLPGAVTFDAAAGDITKALQREVCEIMGNMFGETGTNQWKLESGGTKCEGVTYTATTCAEIVKPATIDLAYGNLEVFNNDYCNNFRFELDTSLRRCTMGTGACDLDETPTCADTEVTSIEDGAKCTDNDFLSDSDKTVCMVDNDITDFASYNCVEVNDTEKAAAEDPTNVQLPGTPDTDVDAAYCIELGNVIDPASKAWVVDNRKCKYATSCEEIDWSDVTSWSDIATPFDAETLCPSLSIEGEPELTCKADVSTTACVEDDDVIESDCDKASGSDFSAALAKCPDVTTEAGFYCYVKKDLSGGFDSPIACKQFTDGNPVKTDFASELSFDANNAANGLANAVCVMTSYDSNSGSESKGQAYVASGANTECEAAASCSDIKWELDAISELGIQEADMEATCLKLKTTSEDNCTLDTSTKLACKASQPCDSIQYGNQTLLVSKLLCDGGVVDLGEECRLHADVTVTTCVVAQATTPMKPEEVAGITGDDSDAQCALMGAWYGDSAADNAWTSEDDKCKVAEECADVDWSEAEVSTIGAKADIASEVCVVVKHKGFYEVDGTITEGQVQCKLEASAEHCSGSVSQYVGFFMAGLVAMLL